MKELPNNIDQDKIDLQALKESEARFRSIVLWSPDAIIVTDVKGKIEYINPAAEKFFNRKMESFIGSDFGLPLVDGESTEIDIFRPEKDPGVGDMHVVETEWLNKKAHLITIRDITERKQIEELNKSRMVAEAVSRNKSEFLANMSHELRTPLNSINGFSEILYEETFGPLNGKQKEYVGYVLTCGKHLLLLVNQILDMAKVESGKVKLALSSLVMPNLLRDISTLVGGMASKKQIEISLEMAEDLPNIEADELRVKEIVYNLLSNAIKFTPVGGKIGLRARKVESEIEVVIWDTGIGVAAENMERIFKGFFQVATPGALVTDGAGLGLPLSRKLVELHGGKLSIESAGINKGTQVKFTLPIVSKIAE